MPILLVLIGLLVYMAVGIVICGICRRLVDTSMKHELDDMFALLAALWPIILIGIPLNWLYRLVGGR